MAMLMPMPVVSAMPVVPDCFPFAGCNCACADTYAYAYAYAYVCGSGACTTPRPLKRMLSWSAQWCARLPANMFGVDAGISCLSFLTSQLTVADSNLLLQVFILIVLVFA